MKTLNRNTGLMATLRYTVKVYPTKATEPQLREIKRATLVKELFDTENLPESFSIHYNARYFADKDREISVRYSNHAESIFCTKPTDKDEYDILGLLDTLDCLQHTDAMKIDTGVCLEGDNNFEALWNLAKSVYHRGVRTDFREYLSHLIHAVTTPESEEIPWYDFQNREFLAEELIWHMTERDYDQCVYHSFEDFCKFLHENLDLVYDKHGDKDEYFDKVSAEFRDFCGKEINGTDTKSMLAAWKDKKELR